MHFERGVKTVRALDGESPRVTPSNFPMLYAQSIYRYGPLWTARYLFDMSFRPFTSRRRIEPYNSLKISSNSYHRKS